MTYTEALEYIHGVNWTFCKPGLDRIKTLCEGLGNPQNSLKFIHVAGTNGKGSFCSMTESVLRSAGYKTGLFTSPYIVEFNERMRVNGENISNEELADITTQIRPIADAMEDKPTEFELITAVAFEYFKRNGCDIVVLEAGMGGRLDSTNIIETPLLSVITGIALDHTAFLGDTVEKIAKEKAGIIKNSIPVLYGGDDKAAGEVIKATANEKNAPFSEVDYSKLTVNSANLDGTNFDYKNRHGVKVNLLGLYQPRNAAVVLDAIDILRGRGMNIPNEAITQGLLSALWPARFEIISRKPLIIFDGAHNPQGITSAKKSIKHYFGDEKVYILTGVLKDKDYRFIAKELSEVCDKAFTLTPDNPRALTADEYASVLKEFGVSALANPKIADAFSAAKEAAEKDNKPLLCLGSLYTYTDVIKMV